MVSSRRKCLSVRGIRAVGGVGYEDTNRCEQTGRECAEDGAGKSVDREEMLQDADWIWRVDQVWE